MKKIVNVLLVLSLIAIPLLTEAQEKPTRLYTPVLRHVAFVSGGPQLNVTVWTPSAYDSIVMDSFIVSAASPQIVILKASNTIVKLLMGASDPVVSPGNFLWKGDKDESILMDFVLDEISITVTGWEETN